MPGPVLLGGLDHSGKTQLRLALELAPDVAWFRRAEPWMRHAGHVGDVRDPAIARRAIDRLVADRRLADLAPDRDALLADLAAGPPPPSPAVAESRLLGAVLAHAVARTGHTRWGLQEAGVERFADPILGAFPDARLVVLVRDPRDRLAAILREGARPGAAGPTTAAWLTSIRRARAAVARHPERVLIVRAESLAAEPEATLRHVCEHAEVPFDPQMVRPASGDPFGALAASVGTFRRRLGAGQVAFVQGFAGRTMAELGYPPDPVRLDAAGRLRFWFVDAPLGLGRLAAARARTVVTGRAT